MNHIEFLKKVLFCGLMIGLVAVIAMPNPAMSAWPTKDIAHIVPFNPGGGFDTQSRIFAPAWEKKLPQKANVVVMNKPGAGGKIGTLVLLKSAPDGYTIGTLSPSALSWMYINGEIENIDIRKLGYLGLLSAEPGAVVVSVASGIKSIQDMTKREFRIASDTDAVFTSSMLVKQMGLKARMLMFNSSAEKNLALMRGDVDIMLDGVSTSKRGVDNSQGKVVPLFIVADKRAPNWPEVPCSKELGVELGDLKYIAGDARSLVVPAGMPADLLKTLQDTAWQALQDPALIAGMEKAGFAKTMGSAAEASTTATSILRVIETNRELFDPSKKK